MFIAMNRLRCPAAFSDNLERAFRTAGNLSGVPGFIRFQFLRALDAAAGPEQALYVALSQWESREAYEAWVKSESFDRMHRSSADSPISAELETYEVIE